MLFIIISLLLVVSATAQSVVEDPSFEWLQEESEFGVPLLKITFPNGESDNAILRNYNPVPLDPTERAEDVDSCIFRGFLEKESSMVTLTGCPFSGSFQVQFSSLHLKQNVFKVVDWKLAKPNEVTRLAGRMIQQDRVADFGCDNNVNDLKINLSKNGYVLNLKTVYDTDWEKKFQGDKFNAIRRVLAHTEHVMQFPSLTTKIYFTVDKEVLFANEKLDATGRLRDVAPRYATDLKYHVYVFFTAQLEDERSGGGGKARPSGACDPDPNEHAAIVDWSIDDIECSTVLAHELGHSIGMDHDFCGRNESSIRIDSKGNPCTFIGGLMSYESYHVGDNRHWSTCSVEDLNKLVHDKPKCFKEYDPKNPPEPLPQLALSSKECDLRKSKGNLLGYNNVTFDGKSCLVQCVDGICAPSRKYSNCRKGPTACQRICGKASCDVATDF